VKINEINKFNFHIHKTASALPTVAHERRENLGYFTSIKKKLKAFNLQMM